MRIPGSRRVVRAVALGLMLACAGCRSNEPRPRTGSSRAEAEAASANGDWNLAAECWYGVFLNEPHAPDACANAARAFLARGDPDDAIHVLARGIEAYPDDPELLELKGHALVALGFRRAAEESFERVAALDPERTSAWAALGQVRIELGLESKAIDPLNKVIAHTGGDYATYRLLARAAHASGDPRAAIQAWTEAFKHGPGTTEDLVEAATLYLDESVRRAGPEVTGSVTAWLQKALALDPKCTKAHFMLGRLDEELRRPAQAVEHYRRAVEIDPKCLMALTNLAILYDALGDEENAREMIERALSLETDPVRKRALQRLRDRHVVGAKPAPERP